MADIINNPAGNDSGGTGLLIGGILLVLFVMIFVVYVLPAMRGSTQNSAPEAATQEAPKAEGGDGGSITIPDEVNVNVNQPQE